MDSFCLYHQLTNEKSRQKYGSDTTYKSSSKKGKSFMEFSNQNISVKNHQEFNDYTIQPQRQKSRSKKIKLEFKKASEKYLPTKPQQTELKSSRFEQAFDQQYFVKQQKQFRKTKSLKDSKQRIKFTTSQLNKKTHTKQQYCQKMTLLQNRIYSLSQKIQTCETQTRKNHFQFVLLRDIVQKLKIENLELISKLNVYDDFIKRNTKTSLQYETLNEQNLKLLQILQNYQNFNHQNKHPISQTNYEDQMYASTQQINDIKQNGLNSINVQNHQYSHTNTNTNKACEQTNSKTVNQCSETSQQKTKQQTHQKKEILSKSKKLINQNAKSTVKRNKPKKILHFQNIITENKTSREIVQQNQKNKVEELFQIQNFGEIENNSSANISEQNLLESVEMFRKASCHKRAFQKPNLGNKEKYHFTNQQKEETSITCKPSISESPYNFNKRDVNDQQANNRKEMQNQYQELLKVLLSLRSKQKSLSPTDKQLPQIKAQKQRVEKIILALQNTYQLNS